MMYAGVISSHHPGSILFGRHESLASAWRSNKSNCQINNRLVSDLFPSQLLARLPRTSFCYYSRVKVATTKRNYYRDSVSNDGFDQLPFWLIKDLLWNIKSLFLFFG
ncbi:hypothetical protein HPP92_012280 [Vanilla planifolia]|uniref:Uncharacterized protein n=1 Tax=Vanilla planifolia TaxID=51239 RepID=A0A835QQ71_VANPL|nr:hypothetical protein HPP92_012280 [Vanilla planifolia]